MQMNHKNLLLFACACCTLIQASELVITSRITVNDKDQAALVAELNADGQALTRKYADASGVCAVETTVQVTRCEVCSTGGNRAETKCNCGKPRPRAEAEDTKCGCNRPKGAEAEEFKCGCNRPKGEADETKCGCNRPKGAEADEFKCGCNRPKGEAEDTKCGCSRPTKDALAECADCQGHFQVADKVLVTVDGQRVCADCNEQLRSCSSCCKDKCCKKCKKCCDKCCTSTSTCTSCCK